MRIVNARSSSLSGKPTAQSHAAAVRAALNQFNKALDKNQASVLFKLLLKYQPEAKAEKKERLLKEAEARADGKVRPLPLPLPLRFCDCLQAQFAASTRRRHAAYARAARQGREVHRAGLSCQQRTGRARI